VEKLEILKLNTEADMKKIILLAFILMQTGCAVVNHVADDIKLGVQQDIAGFKEDWIRTFGNGQNN
jgi:hypothetical protein